MPNGGRRSRRSYRGFTLIELLVVILIIAILMAVAMPLYLAVVTDSQLKSCRSNMQTIANAEAAYKTATVPHVYTTVLTDLNSNLLATPVCPSGGTYSVSIGSGTANNGTAVPSGGLLVSCSASGHGVFAPGIDGQ